MSRQCQPKGLPFPVPEIREFVAVRDSGKFFQLFSRDFPGLGNPRTDPGNSHGLLEFSEYQLFEIMITILFCSTTCRTNLCWKDVGNCSYMCQGSSNLFSLLLHLLASINKQTTTLSGQKAPSVTSRILHDQSYRNEWFPNSGSSLCILLLMLTDFSSHLWTIMHCMRGLTLKRNVHGMWCLHVSPVFVPPSVRHHWTGQHMTSVYQEVA